MAIERTTPTIGASIIQSGTRGWGVLTNKNWDLADAALAADRGRITALETTSAVLPLAIVNKIGHNILRNNIFAQGTFTAPENATFWGPAVFLNGAIGNSTRTNQTTMVGQYSQRISIANVDTSPSAQTRPYPGLNILDPLTDVSLSSTDPRQLTNGFGYVFQQVTLLPVTEYTLSCYGKVEIPNAILNINVRWKVGIVFKSGLSILSSYFTSPQTNATSDLSTSSFNRAQLTFTTPNIPTVQAEVWLVVEGSVPSSIGSAWFDGAQLEQATSATSLDLFSVDGGNLAVDGDLIVAGNLKLQQAQLVFQANQIIFSGLAEGPIDVQIGTDVTQDTFNVFTKLSTFHGPISVLGSVDLGSDATTQNMSVTVNTTTFANNGNPVTPVGGNVVVEGNLDAYGDVTLGTDPTQDTVTINAQIITANSSFVLTKDLTVDGYLSVKRDAYLGSNHINDALIVKMSSGGSSFEGDVELKNDLLVRGNTTLGDAGSDTVTVNAGSTVLAGSLQVAGALTVNGPSTFNIGSSPSSNFSVTSNEFNVIASAVSGTIFTTPLFDISGNLTVAEGNTASINGTNTTFGTTLLPYTSFGVHSANSSFFGDAYVGGNLTLGGGINSSGSSFTLGSAFSASNGALPMLMTIGNSAHLTGSNYTDTLNVYAGNTFFGDYTTQKKGHVQIGGDLLVAGNAVIGSLTNTISMSAFQFNIELGTGGLKIGGGYTGATYNPLATDHGGITMDANGNILMDGKLTVKGPFDPTQITLNPLAADTSAITVKNTLNATTFHVTPDGYISAGVPTGSHTLSGSVTTGPLSSSSLSTGGITASGSATVSGTLTTGALSASSFSTSGGLVAGSATINGNISSTGTSYVFGSAPSISTLFNVKANNVILGVDGYNIGDVIVGHNLSVRNNVTIGFPSQYSNNVSINALGVSLDVGSSIFGGLETAGFRVGGGYQNNAFNPMSTDHGGVTIDAYGNVFADGSLVIKGALNFSSIVLTVPPGSDAINPVLSIVDNTHNTNLLNYTVDGYGNITKLHGVTTSFPSVQGTAGQVLTNSDGLGTLTWSTISAANTSLSNLVTTSINQDLLPHLDDAYNFGSTTLRWHELHLGPTSLVIHNDTTNTNKLTVGFASSVAQFLTDSATTMKWTIGAHDVASVTTAGAWTFGDTTTAAQTHAFKGTGDITFKVTTNSQVANVALLLESTGSGTTWTIQNATTGNFTFSNTGLAGNALSSTANGDWTLGSSTGGLTGGHTIQNNSTSTSTLLVKNRSVTTTKTTINAQATLDATYDITCSKTSGTTTAGTNKYILFETTIGGADGGYIGSNGANNAAFFATSDARLKTNIAPLGGALDKIIKLNPVSFDWKKDNTTSVGFIAQELVNILPQFVNKTDDGSTETLPENVEPWTMTESGFIPYLVKAIQELKAENDALKARVDGYGIL